MSFMRHLCISHSAVLRVQLCQTSWTVFFGEDVNNKVNNYRSEHEESKHLIVLNEHICVL